LKFSIIVCAYNEEKVIIRCLKSLIKIDYQLNDYEVIIVNDGSNDKTEDLVENFIIQQNLKNFRQLKIQHAGLSIARNAGIDNSNFDIVVFIDADAIADYQILNEYRKTYINKKVEFSGGRINLLNTDSEVAHFFQKTRFKQIFEKNNYKEQLIGANMSFRKKLFLEDGGFPSIFVSRGDDTFIREKFLVKYKYAPTPDAIVLHERPTKFINCLKIFYVESLNGEILKNILEKQSLITKFFKLCIIFFLFYLMVLSPVLIVFSILILILKSITNSFKTINQEDRSFYTVIGYTLIKIFERIIKEIVFIKKIFATKPAYSRNIKNYFIIDK
tara:strand:- start:572 stop:1561 length:990 start_codon:yes stop_codon:yes gene_type:complete